MGFYSRAAFTFCRIVCLMSHGRHRWALPTDPSQLRSSIRGFNLGLDLSADPDDRLGRPGKVQLVVSPQVQLA